MITPLLTPIAAVALGVDPVHVGIVVCLNLVMDLITSLVGTSTFVKDHGP
jgi:TRAP-type C4-dicarboxylate transport system permease large subunit